MKPSRRLRIFLPLLASLSTAHAQTWRWRGGENENWQNSGNWRDESGIPDSDSATALFNANSDRTSIDLSNDLRSVGQISFSGIDENHTLRNGILFNRGNLSIFPASTQTVTFASDLTYVATLGGLSGSGDLNLAGHGSNIFGKNLTINGTTTEPSLTLATAAGFTGDFATVTGLPAGYKLEVTETAVLLVVLSEFELWAEENNLTGDDALITADPDNDGKTNLEEFAFDGGPNSGANDDRESVLITDDGGTDYLTLTVAVRAGATFSGDPLTASIDGITYTILADDDLVARDLTVVERLDGIASGGFPEPGPDYEYRSFRLTSPTTLADAAFIWIGIGQTP